MPARFAPMLAVLCTLALGLTAAQELVDQVYTIPADEWRYVDLGLDQRAARIEAEYEVRSGARQVRLAVMRRHDLEHLREGLAHGIVEATAPGRSGKVMCEVRPPGDYVVVVDNRISDGRPASVRLRIAIAYLAGGPPPERLTPQRRLTVVLLSFAGFLAIVAWSGRKLLPAVKR